MQQIRYVTGDATLPQGEGKKIILHICNDIGKWGKGFVMALSRRYPQPEERYRWWHANREALPMDLGKVQFVPVNEHLKVVNMVAQEGIYPKSGTPPIRYQALSRCLGKVAQHIRVGLEGNWSIHMPRIGAGLAGGDWAIIEDLIKDRLTSQGFAVTVYDLE